MVSNFLPPDSQPWVRALENKVKTLETSITSLKKATTGRVSSAVTTPGGVLTLGGEKVPGEGVLNGSLEHLNGAYSLRYGHEFHGLTQYVLIVSGKASGAGEISLLGPEGQVLDSVTLENDTDVEDATEFYFAVEFPIHTMNYEFEPEDGDGGGPDTDQEVVTSYVLPDTGTLSLVTGTTLDELSYEIRSANSSQVTIDTSSGVPTVTGLSADGTTIDAMHDYSGTLEFLEEARTKAEQNFDELDDKLGRAFPDNIFDVGAGIADALDAATTADGKADTAMTMASGKNAASYTDVADSVAEPGPTPTAAMGLGRPVYDMHRNRRSNGQIIGEWIWTGTAWTQLTLSDAMLSSLDVGKLTAGTADIETAVINKVWGQLGVFDKLDVRTDAYISGINLKDGAVKARHVEASQAMFDKLFTNMFASGKITTEMFHTNAAFEGPGVKISREGVEITGEDGQAFRADKTGNVTLDGTLRTRPSGQRVQIGRTTGGGDYIWFKDTEDRTRVGIGFHDADSLGQLVMYDTAGIARLHLDARGRMGFTSPSGRDSLHILSSDTDNQAFLWLKGPETPSAETKITMGQYSVAGGTITGMQLGTFLSGNNTPSNINLYADGSWRVGSFGRGFVRLNSDGELSLFTQSNRLGLYGLPNTTLTGQPITMIVSSTGKPLIYRNTSRRDSKIAIQNIDDSIDPYRILDVPVRDWYDRTQYSQYADQLELSAMGKRDPANDWDLSQRPRRVPGLVAEELEEAGLDEFCSYDESGTLVGVQYDRVALLLIPIVKDLSERIKTLERGEECR